MWRSRWKMVKSSKRSEVDRGIRVEKKVLGVWGGRRFTTKGGIKKAFEREEKKRRCESRERARKVFQSFRPVTER